MFETITANTAKRMEFVDITEQVRECVVRSKVKTGICHIMVPHTTAAITVNESIDPDVISDLEFAMEKVIPRRANYRHAEGNSAAHIKASLIGFSQTVFIEDGQPALGTWQGIFIAEFDGPRERKVWVKIVATP